MSNQGTGDMGVVLVVVLVGVLVVVWGREAWEHGRGPGILNARGAKRHGGLANPCQGKMHPWQGYSVTVGQRMGSRPPRGIPPRSCLDLPGYPSWGTPRVPGVTLRPTQGRLGMQ